MPLASGMARGSLHIVGIGPGVLEHMSFAAKRVLEECSFVVGYEKYVRQIEYVAKGKAISFPMGKERERVEVAINLAERGNRVALVSSGDPGIYGMASLALELAEGRDIDVEIIPGIPALTFAASKVGVPLGGDFSLISLSDLLIPWEKIVFNLDRASLCDVSIVLVNPGSSKRRYHLAMAANTILRYRLPDTPVAIVENAFSNGERIEVTSLTELEDREFTSMNAIVFVGCSRTRVSDGRMITDRGYFRKGPLVNEVELEGSEDIERASLDFIKRHLKAHNFSHMEKEIVARMVHAAADFSIASLVEFKEGFCERASEVLRNGGRVIVDTQMALSGISKAIADELGVEVKALPKCEPPSGYTKSAWGLRLLKDEVAKSLVVVGNAPTVLMELKRLADEGVKPKAVIGVPVGFVGTVRAKGVLKELGVPYLTVWGNRGGTPIAVAAVNALLRLACG